MVDGEWDPPAAVVSGKIISVLIKCVYAYS